MTEPLPSSPADTSEPRGETASRLALALVDLAAVSALALAGAWFVATLDRVGALGRTGSALLALPFSLAGPFGVGVERGRGGSVGPGLALAVALAASLGALAALVAFEGPNVSPLVIAERALPALLLGAPLALAGTRFARPDEDWRAAARRGPADATPAFALRLARGRLPLPVRLVTTPIALASVPIGAALLVSVRCYQITLSRLMPPQCRFEPSCSRYGFEALRRFGLARGVALTLYRLGRCHPFCNGGHDPVPAASDASPGEAPASDSSPASRVAAGGAAR